MELDINNVDSIIQFILYLAYFSTTIFLIVNFLKDTRYKPIIWFILITGAITFFGSFTYTFN